MEGDCCNDSCDFVHVLQEPGAILFVSEACRCKEICRTIVGLGSVGSIEVGAQHSQFRIQKYMFSAVNDAQRSAVEDIVADAGQK